MSYLYKNYKPQSHQKTTAEKMNYQWPKNVKIHQHVEENLKILSQDNRNEVKINGVVNDLIYLQKDVDDFLGELHDDLLNPVKIKFLQKEAIQKQITYLEDLED